MPKIDEYLLHHAASAMSCLICLAMFISSEVPSTFGVVLLGSCSAFPMVLRTKVTLGGSSDPFAQDFSPQHQLPITPPHDAQGKKNAATCFIYDLYMVYIWFMYGLCMVYMWFICGLYIYGLSMDYLWIIIHG